MLPSIGLSIIRHKCYAETINAEVTEANQHLNQAPNHDNQSQPPQQHRTTRNHSNLKTKAPQLPKLSKSLSRPCPEPLPEGPSNPPSPSHTPHLMVGAPPDRGPTEPGRPYLGGGWSGRAWEDNSVGPSKGGPHRTAQCGRRSAVGQVERWGFPPTHCRCGRRSAAWQEGRRRERDGFEGMRGRQ